jgi:hypothetical protein
MADDITIATSGGTETIGADEISSVKYPRNKLIYGPDGTNTGDVQLASTSAAGPLPVNAYLASDYVLVAGVALSPKFARVQLAADGNIVAAVTDKKIRVLAMAVSTEVVNDDLDVEDGSGGTTLFRFINIPLGMTVLPFNPVGWFETTVTTALYGDVTLVGATEIDVHVVYVEV